MDGVATPAGGCYYKDNPQQPYCMVVIASKVLTSRKKYSATLKKYHWLSVRGEKREMQLFR